MNKINVELFEGKIYNELPDLVKMLLKYLFVFFFFNGRLPNRFFPGSDICHVCMFIVAIEYRFFISEEIQNMSVFSNRKPQVDLVNMF